VDATAEAEAEIAAVTVVAAAVVAAAGAASKNPQFRQTRAIVSSIAVGVLPPTLEPLLE
jgi:hypothetical protein